ncbi:hypothetical protein A7K93_08315 [Candidatus Methylacidiphilum fumarolicum]|nr:hypothetical protein A7K72_10385 [Candidatus Methylacidiphilum fumarolicum]TFE72602.1 hypothetical protein A7K93_08315 [Candidatus Methylacidiphilum fumarolicum]
MKGNFYYKSIGGEVGVDFGIDSKLTLSNGIKIDFEWQEFTRLKRLQRKLTKLKNDSKNKSKVQNLLKKEHEEIRNKRKDAQNKTLAFLKLHRGVVFQEDFLKDWARLFGRQVHASGIGELKSRLRNSLETPVFIGRYEPTT